MHSITVGQMYTYTIADYVTRENAYYHAWKFAMKWNLTVRNLRDNAGELLGYTVG